MRSGILNEQIQILKLIKKTNDFGEPMDFYEPCCSTRANITPMSGGRTDENHEVFYEHTYKFIVRRYVPVCDFDRIMWHNKQYRILNIDDDRQMNQKIITCEIVNI